MIVEHDYDFHGFCHPFIEIRPGYYVRLAPHEGKAWAVDSVKERGRHRQDECPDREMWAKAFRP